MIIFDQQQVDYAPFLAVPQMLGWLVSVCPSTLASCPPTSYLHLASWHGVLGPLLLLRRLGVRHHLQDASGRTPLHLAALRGHAAVLGQLLAWLPNLLEERDCEGRTALHLAALASHLACTTLLLNHGAAPSAADLDTATPLHLARDTAVVEVLLERGADPTISPPATVLRHYLTHVPREVTTLLNSRVTHNGAPLGAGGLAVGLDMGLWQVEAVEGQGETQVLLQMVANDEGLKHPVCEAFIHLKDAHFGGKMRLLSLLLYTFFMASLSTLVMADHSRWMNHLYSPHQLSTIHSIALATSSTLSSLLLLRELLFIALFWRTYFKDPTNTVLLVLLTSSTVYMVLVSMEVEASSSSLQLGAGVVVLAWLLLTSILGRFPGIGIYVLMVQTVARDVVGFLLIYSIILLAFALGFHLVLASPGHRTPFASFVATLAMMYGEIDFASNFSDDTVTHHGITELLFILFLLLVGIIIMNLLVGLSISNISTIFQSSGITRLRQTVEQVRATPPSPAPSCTCWSRRWSGWPPPSTSPPPPSWTPWPGCRAAQGSQGH